MNQLWFIVKLPFYTRLVSTKAFAIMNQTGMKVGAPPYSHPSVMCSKGNSVLCLQLVWNLINEDGGGNALGAVS